MAWEAFSALAPVIGGSVGTALGAIGGAIPKTEHSTSLTRLTEPQSELEGLLSGGDNGSLLSLYKELQRRMSSNPYEDDQRRLYEQQNQATDQYANLLQQLTQTGGVPTQEHVNAANQYAQQAFSAEQTGLNQLFQDQTVQSQRMAAQMGRSIGDPILRAKLAQEQIRQQSALNSRQTAFAGNYAQGLGQRQLQGAEALMGLRQGLASQAMQNRLTLLNLGSQLQANERNFRLSTAARSTEGTSGGGWGGGIAGGLAGAGVGARTGQMFGGSGVGEADSFGKQNWGNVPAGFNDFSTLK